MKYKYMSLQNIASFEISVFCILTHYSPQNVNKFNIL